ncbi:MAG: response regulator transcription factor [Chitinophaga sp.]|nr:response regulator transcription factor [Chitinophaga sp.]
MEAVELFQKQAVDLLILDVYMPHAGNSKSDRTGLDLGQWVREKDKDIPIIHLSGSITEEDVIEGYEGGCDYYLGKGMIDLEELHLRIGRILSRYDNHEAKKYLYPFGDYAYDARRRHLICPDHLPIDLPKMQGHLLKILARHFQKYVPVERILAEVWGKTEGTRRSLHVHIRKLRQNLPKRGGIMIRGDRKKGYALVDDSPVKRAGIITGSQR